MEAKNSKMRNQRVLAEALVLVVIFMVILALKANTPIREFFLGALWGMWLIYVMAFLGVVGKKLRLEVLSGAQTEHADDKV